MGCAHSRFTVLFEGPFWIGLYEREENGLYAACKVTFGAEPSDAEVYAFLNRHWGSLRFSPAVAAGTAARKAPGYKRAMRAARAQTAQTGPGTKARQALAAGRAAAGCRKAPPRGKRSAPLCAAPPKAQGKAQGALAALCFLLILETGGYSGEGTP